MRWINYDLVFFDRCHLCKEKNWKCLRKCLPITPCLQVIDHGSDPNYNRYKYIDELALIYLDMYKNQAALVIQMKWNIYKEKN